MSRYLNGIISFLMVTSCLLVLNSANACGGINQRVYSGKIEYNLDSLNPLHCTVTVTMDFDIDEFVGNDSIVLNWGDLTVEAIHAIRVAEDSAASAKMGSIQIYTHTYRAEHLYGSLPAGGYYTISLPTGQYRINGVNNIVGDVNIPFSLIAEVSIDTARSMQYQALAFAPLTIGFAGLDSYHQNGLQQANTGNGDSVVYSFTTPLEAVSNPVPQYQLPDEFCMANGSGADTFAIDPLTGNISWSSPCLQGVFSVCTMLSRYRNGQLLSSIMCEQNIYVSDNSTSGIEAIPGYNLQLYPNPVKNKVTGLVNHTTATGQSSLKIVDGAGRMLMGNIDIAGKKFEIDVSKLAPGMYFVVWTNLSGVQTAKFVKE